MNKPAKCPTCGSHDKRARICLKCKRVNCHLGVIVGLTTCGDPQPCFDDWHREPAAPPVETEQEPMFCLKCGSLMDIKTQTLVNVWFHAECAPSAVPPAGMTAAEQFIKDVEDDIAYFLRYRKMNSWLVMQALKRAEAYAAHLRGEDNR